MFEKLKEMYIANPPRLNDAQLDASVKKGWITEKQKKLISGSKQIESPNPPPTK